MTHDDEWRPSPSLPREPTEAERARALAAVPRGRFQRKPRLLWVQRIESVTLERGADASVFHPDYEELSAGEDELEWSGLAAAGRREPYRGSQTVPPHLREAADEARARLEDLCSESDASGEVELVVRGEDVAILRQGGWCLAFGLSTDRILGRWRPSPRERTLDFRGSSVGAAGVGLLGAGVMASGIMLGGIVGWALISGGIGVVFVGRAMSGHTDRN